MKQPMFFGERVAIARYDEMKYPSIDKQTDQMLSFFWRPQEIDLSKDKLDFDRLTDNEQHIFTANLKRQILLDSIQGRGITEALTPITSLPEIEVATVFWEAMETIHSRSYTHIIRNVYANPGEVFDNIYNIPEIMETGTEIAVYYDEFIKMCKINDLIKMGAHVSFPGFGAATSTDFERKRALWMLLNCINALEGIRFYVSFACSWAFAELKKMEGNAKIIKLIARDENVHLAITTNLLKTLPADDPDFVKIARDCESEVRHMIQTVVDQEIAWAEYLFADGSMIGLNANLLKEYVYWIASKRMKALGIKPTFTVARANPLPWTESWIGGGAVQVAPQESEKSDYLEGGGMVKDGLDSLKGFEL